MKEVFSAQTLAGNLSSWSAGLNNLEFSMTKFARCLESLEIFVRLTIYKQPFKCDWVYVFAFCEMKCQR